MDYQEYSDSELYSMVCEASEEAKEIIYTKYKYIIDVIIKKYVYTAKKLGVEYNDLYQEGFQTASGSSRIRRCLPYSAIYSIRLILL